MRSALSGTLRKDGRWQLTLTLTRGDGAKIRTTLYAPTQRDVQRKARAILNVSGRTAHERHTVAELIEVYRAERWDVLSDGDKRQKGPMFRRIAASMGQEDVREISAPRIALWLKSLASDPRLGGRSVQVGRNNLSVLLGYANELGWRDGNPARGLRLPVSARPKKRPRLTPFDYARILEAEPCATLRDLWETLGETGLRPSEALALRRQDIFYSQDMWWVRGGMKTQAGTDREIPLPDALAHRLIEQTGWLFPFPGEDRPYRYRHVHTLWGRAIKNVDADPAINLYQLRKLAVSRWFANGVPDEVIEAIAGHTDIALARSVYNRMGRERLMESLFSPLQNPARSPIE